ncbi:hypothetical protein M436DRAFT_65572 [Aureobasidium namibiae CBS 147.97]|uniref:Uncharacterized protein n=1 Tax=Aureobasidium namibiae CBS 147.97 TaxID=1043004 RepID=A0A074WEC1_9PEZI|nr:uncharacterized protein M436DRAFT_65572 [Aureobasidium namibiae CBS 147.97]KEQ71445.1 hypothetical protein M436DRAFT_65572 [Aureobasidium namibiae CBS 147.97]
MSLKDHLGTGPLAWDLDSVPLVAYIPTWRVGSLLQLSWVISPLSRRKNSISRTASVSCRSLASDPKAVFATETRVCRKTTIASRVLCCKGVRCNPPSMDQSPQTPSNGSGKGGRMFQKPISKSDDSRLQMLKFELLLSAANEESE